VHDSELIAADAAIADRKVLPGFMPEWVSTSRGFQCSWQVLDALDSRPRGTLRFEADRKLEYPSISLVVGNGAVTRLDVVPPNTGHDNPLGARSLGLPPKIVGTHMHSWDINPFAKSFELHGSDFAAAFRALCLEINLTIEHWQSTVRLPSQPELF
jgi:hypothetical protein